jgi:uncharacterized protein YbjT (DUF2867 family)
VAVLGAGGLIGAALAEDLARRGLLLRALARRFTRAQRATFGAAAFETPFARLEAAELRRVLAGADVVVNCVGVLQDGPRGRTDDVHERFVATLIAALRAQPKPVLLVHVSIPGAAADDRTAFSLSKRAAERLIEQCGLPYVILRPGFVIAPAAYGGGALIRALAALPSRLGAALGARPFAFVAIYDLCATVRRAAELWASGWPGGGVAWDAMAPEATTVTDVVEAFRARFGGPAPRGAAPAWLLRAGALAGDAAALLGWSPPVRSTALAEMRRGVAGDPSAWMAATGIQPASLGEALARLPATVQEAWFARLYLLKAAIVAGLAGFWIASGVVALGPGYAAASGFLAGHGVPAGLAGPLAWATALADIGVGAAIALRRASQGGLIAGLALTGAYVVAATMLAPALWTDPLGPLVKTAPLVLAMLAALAILPER